MTNSQLEHRVHLLSAYAIASSLLIGILLLGGFESDDVVHHDKVITERLEVVESDEDPVLVAANSDRFPRAEDRAPEGEKEGTAASGLVFYDGDGQELGALHLESTETDSGRRVLTQLKFDRYNHNAVLGIAHGETPSSRSTGILLNEQVGTPTEGDTRRRATLATFQRNVRFELRDHQARPRIRMEVDSSGTARLVFLDKKGEVMRRYPPKN